MTTGMASRPVSDMVILKSKLTNGVAWRPVSHGVPPKGVFNKWFVQSQQNDYFFQLLFFFACFFACLDYYSVSDFDSNSVSDSNSDSDSDSDSSSVFMNLVNFIFFDLYLHSSK